MKENLLLLTGTVIGILFGLGFSDWGKINSGSVADWIIAFGTVALVFIAIYTALSWKAQRIPEARKNFIDAIVDFDNYIYQFKVEDFTSTIEKFRLYHTKLLIKFWNVEKSIMYFYQFDKTNKEDIDHQYCKIITLIDEFGKNLKCNTDGICILQGSKLETATDSILKESYMLLKLVTGEDLTVQCPEKKNDQHSQP